MAERPNPSFRVIEKVSLTGTMAVYASQAEASLRIPQQWQEFRSAHPSLGNCPKLYGASPCTADHKIHYLTGVEEDGAESLVKGESLTLEAGEYAVVRVDDPDSLRETWMYLLGSWLPSSGRKEKHAPEFERYASISEAGTPIGPVEVWIPLETITES
jgi:AraC family transcriptional regulator